MLGLLVSSMAVQYQKPIPDVQKTGNKDKCLSVLSALNIFRKNLIQSDSSKTIFDQGFLQIGRNVLLWQTVLGEKEIDSQKIALC